MTNFLTILVALAKLGSLYARQRRDKQAFQAASIILIMLIILHNENQKKKINFYNKYRRTDEF